MCESEEDSLESSSDDEGLLPTAASQDSLKEGWVTHTSFLYPHQSSVQSWLNPSPFSDTASLIKNKYYIILNNGREKWDTVRHDSMKE